MTELLLTFTNLSLVLHSISIINACNHIVNLMMINSHNLLQCICTSVLSLLYSVRRLLDKLYSLAIHFPSFEDILVPPTKTSFQLIQLLSILLSNDLLDSYLLVRISSDLG